MAATCFGHSDPETPEPFDIEDAAPPDASPEQAVAAPPQTPPQVGRQPAPAPTPQEDAAPVETAAPAAAPSGMLDDPALPIEQMRLTVEYGVLMVLGPEGDPVPPYAFAAAAVARPDVLIGLPDGTKAVASRVAAVLGAQILGRLGKPGQGDAWILAMLRNGGRPEDASEDALGAEQDVPGAGEGLAAGAGDFAAGRAAEGGDPTAAREHEQIPASQADAAAPLPDGNPGYGEALDQASLDRAAASIAPGRETLPGLELDFDERAASTDAGLDLDFAADDVAGDALADRPGGEPDDMPAAHDLAGMPHETSPAMAARPDSASLDCGAPVSGVPVSGVPVSGDGHGSAPQRAPDRAAVTIEPATAAEAADAERNIDFDNMVLVVMRGVPEDARLSAGLRDADGSWSISPLDLSTVTISLASPGAGNSAGDDRSADRDLSITGIALAEDGELVAVSETVPLADYLDDPAAADPVSGDPGPMQQAAPPAGGHGIGPEPRMIPLELDPQAWAGGRFDALVIRGLPAGAGLSAGAYDPAIDGWVLRPQDLSALAILPPPDLRADFAVTLMGIALRPGDADAARVLARLPVRLA